VRSRTASSDAAAGTLSGCAFSAALGSKVMVARAVQHAYMHAHRHTEVCMNATKDGVNTYVLAILYARFISALVALGDTPRAWYASQGSSCSATQEAVHPHSTRSVQAATRARKPTSARAHTHMQSFLHNTILPTLRIAAVYTRAQLCAPRLRYGYLARGDACHDKSAIS
jgi:hypothetical protein